MGSLAKSFSNAFLATNTIIVAGFSVIMLLVVVMFRGGLALPMWVPVNLFLIVLMMGIIMFLGWDERLKYNPEGKLFIQSRKKDIPLLMVFSHSGFFRCMLGNKEKEGDIFYAFNRNSNEGIKIAPDVQSGAVPKSVGEKGLQVFCYGTGSPFPMSSKTVIAYDNILRHVRKNYPVLVCFDGATVLEYVSKDRNVLAHDCRNLAETTDIKISIPQEELSRFKAIIAEQVKQDAEKNKITDENEINETIEKAYQDNIRNFVVSYRSDYLVKAFMKIQDETANLPLPNKYFSFAEGFMHSISAFTAFDYQTLMQLFEMIARKENEMDLKWMAGVAFAVLLVLVGGGIAYQMIGSAKK